MTESLQLPDTRVTVSKEHLGLVALKLQMLAATVTAAVEAPEEVCSGWKR